MNIEFKKNTRLLFVILLLLILITVLIWFIVSFRNLYRLGAFRPVRPLYHRSYNATKPLLQPEQIEGWMTFRYINFIFRLPANYLSGRLAITDPVYPNVNLDKYAKMHKLNNAVFIKSVRQGVAVYSNGGNL